MSEELIVQFNALLAQSRQLCAAVEALPAGEVQTKMSVAACDIAFKTQEFLRAHAGENWYRETTVEMMPIAVPSEANEPITIFPKKILGVHGFFALPDDFDGDLNDALEALVAYRRSGGAQIGQNEGKLDIRELPTVPEVWQLFLEAYEKEGRHFTGIVAVGDVAFPAEETKS